MGLALAIILGSAWIGIWRAQRQYQQADAPSLAPQDATVSMLPPMLVDPEENLYFEVEGEDLSQMSLALMPVPATLMLPEGAVSPEQLAELIEQMRIHVSAGRLLEPADGSAFSMVERILAVDPENTPARAVLARVLRELRDVASPVFPVDLIDIADRSIDLAGETEDQATLKVLRDSLKRTLDVEALVSFADRQLAREGAGPRAFEIALSKYREALQIDSANARALRGLEEVQRRLIERALASSFDLRFSAAETLLKQAEDVQVGSSRVLDARSQVMAFRSQTESTQLDAFKEAISRNQLDAAEKVLGTLRKVLSDPTQVRDLESKITNVRLYGGFSPDERFTDSLRDGSRGPRMSIVPVGSFRMGSPQTEPARNKNEGPQRSLRFERGFAMARGEISVLEFRAFVDATGYVTDAEKLGSSAIYNEKTGRMTKSKRVNWRRNYNGSRARDGDPVIHVSWNDATEYARWLSAQTGKTYRLPSEAEYEYALRAGSDTVYPWGDSDPVTVLTNVAGADEVSREGRRWSNGLIGYNDLHWGPAPVRSFSANAFRLYDLDGNVSEWVSDCWHDDFQRAPGTPVPWVNPGCDMHVLRGGSWGSGRDQVRSAWRGSALADSSGARVGFRVAREL